MTTKYYDGTKLLSLMDANGNRPELYMVDTNRSAGKTTFFGRRSINKFKKKGEQFILLYRFKYELVDVDEKFFNHGLKDTFFPKDEMTCKLRAKGGYAELFLNEVTCGYAIAINDPTLIKTYSQVFNKCTHAIFDEYQSESNHYCQDEVKKLLSIHKSVARGGGQQQRYFPIYMLSNNVSLLNPYFTALGISNKIKTNTNFLRGDGYVLEHGFNESASKSIKESGISRAFADNEYIAFSSEKVYLNDSTAFVENVKGKGTYICTIKYKNKSYGLYEYLEQGCIFVSDKADMSFPRRLAITTDDHDVNYVMLRRNDNLICQLRYYFERGCFRFKNLECKEMTLNMLSY